ncbi:MAG: serine/threonine-protein kinase [Potamolinea sp.]
MSQYCDKTNSEPPIGGRYKIISELGTGGFGQTFLALDLHLPGNPKCVVKQLKPQTKDPNSLAMARRLFDTEAQALYQLGDHDQIPRLLAHFEDNQEFYLVQELVEGEPLTQELASGKPWTQTQAIALLQDILTALAFVHQQNVIHRDLKPPNLIRRRADGKVVLIDFGAVKQVSTQSVDSETGKTNLTISIGTQGYMPNEQLAGTPRFSSDVYAVGMLGIQALTGLHPKRLEEDPDSGEVEWRSNAKHVCPELADILDKMVCYDFRDRYPSAVEALEALGHLPASLLESIPPAQFLPEVREATNSNSSQQQPSPALTTETKESEIEQQPTNIWASTPSLGSTTGASSTDSTTPWPQPEHSQSSIQRQLLQFWTALAVLAAVGVTLVLFKSVLSPQHPPQSAPSATIPTKRPRALLNSPLPKLTALELIKQANRSRKAGDYQNALSLYDQALDLRPRIAQAHWGRCESLSELKKPAEAIVACNDALSLKPNYAEAFWSKGKALEQQKLPLEALQLYEQATEIQPDFTEAWVSYGLALQGFGRSEEAIIALDKAIALNRDLAIAWRTKGAALWNLGRLDEAIASFDKALQIEPNNSETLKLRNKARKELGR